jgi:hypothetical protein
VDGRLREEGHPIHGAVLEYITRCRRINNHILARIQQTFDLDGFSGDTTVGIKKGAPPFVSVPMSKLKSQDVVCEIRAIYQDTEEDTVIDDDDDDDEANGDIGCLMDYVTDLPTRR